MTFAKWAAVGFPGRHPDDVRALFNDYCVGIHQDCNGNWVSKPCDLYDREGQAILFGPKGLCRGCGCHVSDDASEWTNAIVIKGCPKGFFSGVVEEQRV